jgi:hypothetical protein
MRNRPVRRPPRPSPAMTGLRIRGFIAHELITIEAPPEQVWPWIVQTGMERAGFYSHDWVERLLARARYVEGRHSATRIHPELQDLEVGDLVPYGAGAIARVEEIEPFRHLVVGETFLLRPLPGDRTRLIVRYQGKGFISAAAGAVAPDAAACRSVQAELAPIGAESAAIPSGH